MDVELMILGFLMSGPKTGYRLKAISGKMIMFYNITLNKIYPVLRKLEACGLITKEVVFQTGKPNKHLYSLTSEGKTYFIEKLQAPSVPMELGTPFFIRSFFNIFPSIYSSLPAISFKLLLKYIFLGSRTIHFGEIDF